MEAQRKEKGERDPKSYQGNKRGDVESTTSEKTETQKKEVGWVRMGNAQGNLKKRFQKGGNAHRNRFWAC